MLSLHHYMVGMVKLIQKIYNPAQCTTEDQAVTKEWFPTERGKPQKQVLHSVRAPSVLLLSQAAMSPAWFSREAGQDDLPCPDSQQNMVSMWLFPQLVIYKIPETTEIMCPSMCSFSLLATFHPSLERAFRMEPVKCTTSLKNCAPFKVSFFAWVSLPFW